MLIIYKLRIILSWCLSLHAEYEDGVPLYTFILVTLAGTTLGCIREFILMKIYERMKKQPNHEMQWTTRATIHEPHTITIQPTAGLERAEEPISFI